jgi:CII-binding regulator of phage lambda lysogenization HflD
MVDQVEAAYSSEQNQRIAELEREKQMYINSTDRLTARVKELEAKLAKASEAFDAASRAFTACDIKRYNRIKELETENAHLLECLNEIEQETIDPAIQRIAWKGLGLEEK